jgi:hypothetical protein
MVSLVAPLVMTRSAQPDMAKIAEKTGSHTTARLTVTDQTTTGAVSEMFYSINGCPLPLAVPSGGPTGHAC